ncbi:MAG: hypothetical protein J6U39_04915 [Clostridia bacterium]|nr:hypothetical protein [Clostridia bacterium]
MEYYHIKRVGGKGYENKYLVVRKRKKREYAFLLFLILFGVTVYLAASLLFRTLYFGEVRVSLPVLL